MADIHSGSMWIKRGWDTISCLYNFRIRDIWKGKVSIICRAKVRPCAPSLSWLARPQSFRLYHPLWICYNSLRRAKLVRTKRFTPVTTKADLGSSCWWQISFVGAWPDRIFSIPPGPFCGLAWVNHLKVLKKKRTMYLLLLEERGAKHLSPFLDLHPRPEFSSIIRSHHILSLQNIRMFNAMNLWIDT